MSARQTDVAKMPTSDRRYWARISRGRWMWMTQYGQGLSEYSEIADWAFTERGVVRKASRRVARWQANDLIAAHRASPGIEITRPTLEMRAS